MIFTRIINILLALALISPSLKQANAAEETADLGPGFELQNKGNDIWVRIFTGENASPVISRDKVPQSIGMGQGFALKEPTRDPITR
ncbi:MAG TPA: hypothetical protein VEL47_01750, partial [Myxococcota bacterium]|nr:hypothetical protein [Myxococcota bacterium]